ncbi:hypothetical protein CFC21_049296, partial [Triticum aestivum]
TPSHPTTAMSPSRRSSPRSSPVGPRPTSATSMRPLRAHPRVRAGIAAGQQEDGLRRAAPEHEHRAVRARRQRRCRRQHADGALCRLPQQGEHRRCRRHRHPPQGALQGHHTT